MRTTTPYLWIAVSAGIAAWAILGRLARAQPAEPLVRPRRDVTPWFI